MKKKLFATNTSGFGTLRILLFLFLTFTGGSNCIFAQSSNKTPKTITCLMCPDGLTEVKTPIQISVDFKSKSYSIDSSMSLGKNEYYRIYIKGVNPNLFNVRYNNLIDTVNIKAISLPLPTIFSIDGLTKIISTIGGFSTSLGVKINDFSKEEVSSLGGSNQPSLKSKETHKRFLEKYHLDENTDRCEFTFFLDYNKTIKIGIDSVYNNLISVRNNLIRTKVKIDATDLEILKYKYYHSGIIDTKPELSEKTKIFVAILNNRAEVQKIIEDITVKENNYLIFSSSNSTIIEKDDELKKIDKTVKDSFGAVKDIVLNVFNAISATKIDTLFSPISNMVNKDTPIFSQPFKYNGNKTKLIISITPKNKQDIYLKADSIFFELPKLNTNYNLVGLSYYYSGLHDDAYTETKTITKSDTTFSYGKESNNSELGLAALLRFGDKFDSKDKSFGYHASLGAGISLSNKIKPRFLFGGGLSYGKKHLITLDAGLIVGYVDRRSDFIKESTTYNYKINSVIVSKLSASYFISLGYAFNIND